LGHLKYRWRLVRPRILSGFLYYLVRAVCATLRFEMRNLPADHAKLIFCGWHGRSFAFSGYFRKRGWYVIISHSSDGDMQNYIFSRLGYKIIRGSTGRGGVRAAKEAITALEDGGTMAMTPDGPRGPSGVVQGGVMLMARKSGAGLIPVGIAARPRVVAKSWDKYNVPVPFSKCLMIFGEPLYVSPKATEEEVEQVRLNLESEIHRLEKQAEAELGLNRG
jgi:lysophospholipid acyltransferase (LPLAT)-like uncharacterized protein